MPGSICSLSLFCSAIKRGTKVKADSSNKEKVIVMILAVAYENGSVFQHFGHCTQFKLYEIENTAVCREQIVTATGSGHGALAGFLQANQVDTLLCGGIGTGARSALAQAGIRLYPGVQGNADESVRALLAGRLQFDPDTVCSHHHENEDAHACGADKHGCGGH